MERDALYALALPPPTTARRDRATFDAPAPVKGAHDGEAASVRQPVDDLVKRHLYGSTEQKRGEERSRRHHNANPASPPAQAAVVPQHEASPSKLVDNDLTKLSGLGRTAVRVPDFWEPRDAPSAVPLAYVETDRAKIEDLVSRRWNQTDRLAFEELRAGGSRVTARLPALTRRSAQPYGAPYGASPR